MLRFSIKLALLDAFVIGIALGAVDGCSRSPSTTRDDASTSSVVQPHRMGDHLTCDGGFITDPNNCGVPGTQCGVWNIQGSGLVSLAMTTCSSCVCSGGIICQAGNGCCQTPEGSPIAIPVRPGNAICNNVCVNVLSDPANCARCGVQCGPNSVCHNGICQ